MRAVSQVYLPTSSSPLPSIQYYSITYHNTSHLQPEPHSTGTPLHLKSEPKPHSSSIIHEVITPTTIYNCIASPDPADISHILTHLLATPDVTSCLTLINTLKVSKGLALADILTALATDLAKLAVPSQAMVTWLDGLAEIEYRHRMAYEAT